MKYIKLFFTMSLTISIINATAQFCTTDDRFSNVEYFSSNELDSLTDVTYGNAINWQGNSEALKLDLYFPDNTIDTISSRPLVVLIHGGGFEGGDKISEKEECLEFAKRGYVTATINYRLGFNPTDPISYTRAIYRAQQDANAAIRYCMDIAESVKIDTSWVFIGGGSAGSITSLYTTYLQQEEWILLDPDIETTLGSLNNNGNSLTHLFTIDGIYNLCGAGPNSIDLDELTPMVSFHGLLDEIVPIDTADLGTLGSRSIHNILIDEGICNDITIDTLAGHCPFGGAPGVKFRIERASCFFKSIFCEECTDFYSTDFISADCSSNNNSVIELTGTNDVSVYPNPFNVKFEIIGLTGNEYFYLFDIMGRIIVEGKEIQDRNLSQMSKGPYLLRVIKGKEIQTFKIFKN